MPVLQTWLKRLQLKRILTVVVAGFLLVITTACNTGDMQGARPANPPVQMGGNNNPYKDNAFKPTGGDSYTQYKFSTDPKLDSKTQQKGYYNQRDHAQLPGNAGKLVAITSDDIQYPGAETPLGRIAKEQEYPIITAPDKLSATSPKQPVINRNDPDTQILEGVGRTFTESARFLQEKGEEAAARPEMQSNPARH